MVTSSSDDLTTNADGLRGAMSHLRKRLGTGAQRPRIVTEPHVGYRLVAPD
jgi:DNA-binding winged helix-turn-helix (wHTH) protein